MPLLGCIADDFTGGTDLANNLVKSGFRTVQTIGIPKSVGQLENIDAVVVALKTRTCPVEQAVRESRNALHWLESIGCRQFYFKYCSTFDSTPHKEISDRSSSSFCGNWAPLSPSLVPRFRTMDEPFIAAIYLFMINS